MALFGILAAAIGSLLVLAVWAFGGGALLFVGGRFIAKAPKATYWRSVGTVVLAAIASGIILALASALSFGLLGPLGFVGVPAGMAAGLLVTWLIIKAMFGVSFGKAILAWLPTLAMAVLVLPIVGLLAAMIVPAYQQAQERIDQTKCMVNLRSIETSMHLYKLSETANRYWPADLEAMVKKGYIPPKELNCPCVRGGRRPAGRTCDYFYFPPKRDDDARTIMVCDFGNNHGDGSVNILRAYGSVHRLSAAAFQAELAKPENAAFAEALRQAEAAPATAPAGRE